MPCRILPASLLATALTAVAATAPLYAGHTLGHYPHGSMPQDMIQHGLPSPSSSEQSRARLGVAISAVSQSELDAMNLEYGVRIEQVHEGSVAETAGLRSGDVVTALDDRPAYSPERMQHLVEQVSDTSTIALLREGKSLRLQATFAGSETTDSHGRAVLGVRIQDMTTDLKEAFGARDERGVLISQVMADSPAERAGLKAGDVIVGIGGGSITTVDDLHGALGGYSSRDTLDVSILRDRQEETVQLALGDMSGDAQSRAAHPHVAHGSGKPHAGFHSWHDCMMWKHGCHRCEMQRPS